MTTTTPMNTTEAAAAFGLHPDTLRRYLAEGRALPVAPYRLVRRGNYHWNRAAVERWAEGIR